MDIETLLKKHSAGLYDAVFDSYRGSGNCVTSYSVHSTEPEHGYERKYIGQGACHAVINRTIDRPTALAVITMADRTLETNKGAILFYDWLINKSFFSDVFLCKDPVLSLKYGFVKRLDISAAKWLGAAQLSRLSTSEFKIIMKAVYDILASGFEIHPMLLLLIATEFSFQTDGKIIKTLKKARIDQLTREVFYCYNSSHLPFNVVNNKEILKEICKDDPNKEITHAPYLELFNRASWPNDSNLILSRKMKRNFDKENNDELITGMLKNLVSTTPSLLFGAVNTATNYTYLWPKAVELLKLSLPNKASINGLGINLSGLEIISKQLKLGQ